MAMNRGLVFAIAGFGMIAVMALIIAVIGLTTGYAAADQVSAPKLQNYTTLTVSGYGEVSYAPDRALITFVALGYGETASEALSKSASKATAIISSIEKIGISKEDIETISVSVNPRYDWNQKPPKLIDYEASYTLRVEVKDLKLIGKLIDAAVSAGADRMYGLQFTISDEKKNQLELEAVKSAISEAMTRADEAAKSLGMRVVRVESINLSPQYTPPIPIVRQTLEAAEVPIIPGEGKISATVSMTLLLST
ncbi:MAG: SIMPL domain-containing protein [Thaumarchaeota archaeon]|nr:SIMPL domain-containing protein [Nitrososphaerota archaeon]